jgi:hypothetical protein
VQETGVGVADQGAVDEGEGAGCAFGVVCVGCVGVIQDADEEVSVDGGVESEDAGCVGDGGDGGVYAVWDG